MTLKHDQGFFELDRPANMAVSQYEGPGEFWLIPCLDAVTETLEFLSKKLKKYGGKYKVSEGIRVSVHSFDLFTLRKDVLFSIMNALRIDEISFLDKRKLLKLL